MFTTVEGMHRDGKIERSEMPCDMCKGTPVVAVADILPSQARPVTDTDITHAWRKVSA